jgi:hypothetical protein
MSACLKIQFEEDDLPVEAPVAPAPPRAPWWRGAIHLAALLGFLGLCALLAVVGLLWFSMSIEPG